MNLKAVMARTASAAASLGTISADTTRPRRLEWYQIKFGSEAAAADNPFLYVLQRFTAPGTNTPVLLQKDNPADGATEQDAGHINTVEPTYTANEVVDRIPLNQRATWRWEETRGGCISPATASNGIGIATPVAAAVLISATVSVTEH